MAKMEKTIGEQIKYWRKQRGMTQQELAEKAGALDNKMIYDYESGRRNPSIPALIKIVQALKCEIKIVELSNKK